MVEVSGERRRMRTIVGEVGEHWMPPELLCMPHSGRKEDGQSPDWTGMVFLCAAADHVVTGGHWRWG